MNQYKNTTRKRNLEKNPVFVFPTFFLRYKCYLGKRLVFFFVFLTFFLISLDLKVTWPG